MLEYASLIEKATDGSSMAGMPPMAGSVPGSPVCAPAITRPSFMTTPMWFVWMLRGDIRGGRAIDDTEAQRDFICWWLAFGRAEYPAIWTCGPEHQAVAQAVDGGLTRLLRYLVQCRPDLAEAFAPHGRVDAAGLLCWYRIAGPSELAFAPALPPALEAVTEQPSPDLPWSSSAGHPGVPRIAVALWQCAPQLQHLFPATDPASPAALRHWYLHSGRALLPHPHAAPPPAAPTPATIQKRRAAQAPIGVNLVGYPRGELGIGEDVRMLSAALETAGMAHAIVDVPFGPSARRADQSVARRITTELAYPVTIYCLTAFDTADLFVRHGHRYFASRYRIGNWPWELPQFPAIWQDAFDLVDEVWAASVHTGRSYAGAGFDKPMRLMQPAVAIPAMRRTPWRQRLPNPAAFTFMTPFDPYSSFRRKNPGAVVAAFRAAFDAADTSVALVVRINGDPEGRPGWNELQAAAGNDPRICLWTGTLDRADALGVMRDADCLVSAHRAEGYGRNIAEAKLLGTPVLATGFSGNTDFTGPDEWIAWQPATLAPGEYPHSDGLWWAEPDVAHLAERMQAVRTARHRRPTAAAVRAASASNLQDAGRAYAERIREIVERLG